jgi:hypothetical protein
MPVSRREICGGGRTSEPARKADGFAILSRSRLVLRSGHAIPLAKQGALVPSEKTARPLKTRPRLGPLRNGRPLGSGLPGILPRTVCRVRLAALGLLRKSWTSPKPSDSPLVN